jgi:cysteine desulfurase
MRCTLNVPVLRVRKAAELCSAGDGLDTARLLALRERLNKRLHDGLDEIYNGSMAHRRAQPQHQLRVFEGESLLMGSTTSRFLRIRLHVREPRAVVCLESAGRRDDLAHSSIRFGLAAGRRAEVDYVADKLINVVTRLREMSPLYELAKEGVDLSTMQWVVH